MTIRTSLFGLLFAISSFSCGDASRTRIVEPTEFSLNFEALANGQTVRCGPWIESLGTSQVRAQLLDLKLYIQNLRFVRSDGSEIAAALFPGDWQTESLALLDFQDKDDSCSGPDKPVNTVIRGTLSNSNDIVGLRFSLGMPSAENHGDPLTAANLLRSTSMFWSWQSGHKFMRFDLSPEGGISRPSDPNFLGTNFFFHLGSTNCTGTPERGEAVSCARINQPEIDLNGYQLNISRVTLDIAALLASLDIRVDTEESPGCMSESTDPECAAYFAKLGLDQTSGQVVEPASIFRLQ